MLSLFVQVRAEAEGAARFLLLRLRPCQRVSPHMWPCLLSVLFPGNKGAIFFFPFGWGRGWGGIPYLFFLKTTSQPLCLQSPPLQMTHYDAPKAKLSEYHSMQTLRDFETITFGVMHTLV